MYASKTKKEEKKRKVATAPWRVRALLREDLGELKSDQPKEINRFINPNVFHGSRRHSSRDPVAFPRRYAFSAPGHSYTV